MSSNYTKGTTQHHRLIKARDRVAQAHVNGDSKINIAPESEKCVNITPEDLRAYLMERRRAVLTELDSLNRLLGLKIN